MGLPAPQAAAREPRAELFHEMLLRDFGEAILAALSGTGGAGEDDDDGGSGGGERLAAAFRYLDPAGTGSVHRDDLTTCLHNLDRGLSQRQVEGLLAQLKRDPLRSEQLEYTELVQT